MVHDMRSPGFAPFAEPERASGVRPLPADESAAEVLTAISKLRADATRSAREAAQGDVGVFVAVGRTPDGLSVLDFHVEADADTARVLARALEGHPTADRELGAFPSAWTTSFVSRARALRSWRDPSAQEVGIDPLGAGLPLVDWAGLWVCAGRQLVGWLGVLRIRASRPFGASAMRGLARVVPTVSAAVLESHALFTATYGERGEAFLAPDGRRLCASAGGRRWLELPGNAAAISEMAFRMSAEGLGRLEAPIRGGTARLVRMSGVEVEGYLAELAPPCLVEHAATWDLTPAQLRVAMLAAHGATAQQIALSLGSTEGTVRVHLRDIFRRLGVASRLELARVLGA